MVEYIYDFTFISFNLIFYTYKNYLQLVCKRLLCFPVKHETCPQVESLLLNISSLSFSPVFPYIIGMEWAHSH